MRSVSYRLADLIKARIPLGFVGENEHTVVQFDAKQAFDQYPTATPSLTVKNPSGEKYPAVVTRDGDMVIWTISDSDLIVPGRGEFQLQFKEGDTVMRSYVGETRIERSIMPTGDVPTPVQNWIDAAEDVLEEVEEAIPAGGTTGQVLAKKTNADRDTEWVDQAGGGGGTSNYNDLSNKPQIGGVTLSGDKTLHELGAAAEADIPDVSGFYTKPSGGIPASDIADGVIPTVHNVPAGGSANQVLAKNSGTDYDLKWVNQSGGGGGAEIDDTAGEGDTTVVWSADKTWTETSELKEAIASDETDVADLAKSINANVPYIRTGTATSGSTAWSQTDTVTGIRLKNGQKYTISVSAESAPASTITITLADANNTTLKQVQLASGTTTASDTYTPNSNYDGALIYFKTGIKTGVTLTISISETISAPAVEVLKVNTIRNRLSIPLANSTQSNKQDYKAFYFSMATGTSIYVKTKNGSSFSLLATYADGTTGTLTSVNGFEKSVTLAKDVLFLGYFLLPGFDDVLYIYGADYKEQESKEQTDRNKLQLKHGTFSINGYVNSTGEIVTTSDIARRTDYIDVEQYDHLYSNISIGSAGCSIAFFDSNQDFMSEDSYTGAKLNFTCAIPSGAKYVIFSEYDYHTASAYLYVDGSVSRKQVLDEADIANLTAWKKSIFDVDAFRTFAKFGVCGDSLSVGYMTDSGDTAHGRNLYYSWGQALARRYGNVCLNFGASGQTTATWYTDATYGKVQLVQNDNKCQCYIIGLGVNDSVSSDNVGSTSDIDLSDYTNNADTFCGRYAKIIQTIQEFSSDAIIFALTIPKTGGETSFRYSTLKNDAIKDVVEYLDADNVILIDCDDYADLWVADEITDESYATHYTAIGYQNIATIISMMLSDYMNKHYAVFRDIAFIPYGSNNVIE